MVLKMLKLLSLIHIYIGKEVGGRNYATMIYSLDEVTKRMEKDSTFRNQVTDIVKNLRE